MCQKKLIVVKFGDTKKQDFVKYLKINSLQSPVVPRAVTQIINRAKSN